MFLGHAAGCTLHRGGGKRDRISGRVPCVPAGPVGNALVYLGRLGAEVVAMGDRRKFQSGTPQGNEMRRRLDTIEGHIRHVLAGGDVAEVVAAAVAKESPESAPLLASFLSEPVSSPAPTPAPNDAAEISRLRAELAERHRTLAAMGGAGTAARQEHGSQPAATASQGGDDITPERRRYLLGLTGLGESVLTAESSGATVTQTAVPMPAAVTPVTPVTSTSTVPAAMVQSTDQAMNDAPMSAERRAALLAMSGVGRAVLEDRPFATRSHEMDSGSAAVAGAAGEGISEARRAELLGMTALGQRTLHGRADHNPQAWRERQSDRVGEAKALNATYGGRCEAGTVARANADRLEQVQSMNEARPTSPPA